MKAIIRKASLPYRKSSNEKVELKTFNTLKELLDWQKEIKEDIIIELPVNNNVYDIIIYDDYVE